MAQLLNESGAATASYGYTPYGAQDDELTRGDTDQTNPLNPYRYTGKRFDSGSGSLVMGHRRFGPDTARFLQPDRYNGAFADLGRRCGSASGSRTSRCSRKRRGPTASVARTTATRPARSEAARSTRRRAAPPAPSRRRCCRRAMALPGTRTRPATGINGMGERGSVEHERITKPGRADLPHAPTLPRSRAPTEEGDSTVLLHLAAGHAPARPRRKGRPAPRA